MLISESLSFDESKFKLELFSSVCVKLIPKITENGTNSDQSENKENQPQLTNGNSDKVRVRKFLSENIEPHFCQVFTNRLHFELEIKLEMRPKTK